MKFSSAELLELTTPTGGKFFGQTRAEADQFCSKIARSHYENFPVGSLLVPKRLQRHFYSVYTFARIADDIADEHNNDAAWTTDKRLQALERFERLLLGDEHNEGNPVFTALHATMRECDIPPEPLVRLLKAFRMDSVFQQPRTLEDLEWYCVHSANPVGELVLRIFGLYHDNDEHSAERGRYSDAICTGLQLVNFWQDISRDARDGRITIPLTVMERYGISTEAVFTPDTQNANFCKHFVVCMNELYARTDEYFLTGKRLLPLIPHKRLRAELALTISGGMSILEKTRQLGCSILTQRPVVSKGAYIHIGTRATILFFST